MHLNISNQTLFLGLLFFSIVVRFPLFFPLVIDHDESTYLIIADQLLSGKVPYVDNLDVKPIGIYLLYAGALKIFNSIATVRLLAALVIATSGFLLYHIHFILFSYRRVAMASGFLYVLCASLHKWSWAANTEIFFQLFSLASLYLILTARRAIQLFVFGLIAGLGFLIKFHIAFDILAFVIFYFFWLGTAWKTWIRNMFIALSGFVIPVLLLLFWYGKMGYLEELKFAMISIPSEYSSDLNVGKMFSFIAEFYLSFLPVFMLLLVGLWQAFRQQWMMFPHWILFFSWTFLAWAAIMATGKFFFHYYFQALPVLCLFALTWFMIPGFSPGTKAKPFLITRVYWIFGLLVTAGWLNQYLQVLQKPEVTASVVRSLQRKWQAGDRIYTSDKNILYYLMEVDPPTKYIHTTVLYNPELIRAYQVDVTAEFQAIVHQKMDHYVILQEPHPLIREDIHDHFELVDIYAGGVKLYSRISD